MKFDIKDHAKYRKKENVVISKLGSGLEWRKGHINSTIFKENSRENNIRHGLCLMKGKILYIGCNDGTSCCILSPYCDELVGLDINEEALEVARELIKSQGVTNTKFVHANLCDMPFEANSFDGIYALQVMEHVFAEDQERALKEIRRVLKKGKPFYVQFPHPVSKDYFDWCSKRHGKPEQHVFFFKSEEMIRKHFGRFFKVKKIFRETRANPGRPTERHNSWTAVLQK